MNDTRVVEISDLSKQYRGASEWAVENFKLELNRGEIFGFVGPNGAGKTTTIKMLLGLVRPTRGGGSILGCDIRSQSLQVRQRVSFMSGDVNLYEHMTGEELLQLVSTLHGGLNETRLTSLRNKFEPPAHRRIKTYSAGQKQQMALMAALSHDSDVLILDEPTKGLDPSKKRLFLDLIAERGKEGAAVIISSHVLSEIEDICDRVGFIRKGQLLGNDEIDSVRSRLSKLIIAGFEDGFDIERLNSLPFVEQVQQRGKEYRILISGEGREAIKGIADLPVTSLRYRSATLEDLYEHLYLNDSAGMGTEVTT